MPFFVVTSASTRAVQTITIIVIYTADNNNRFEDTRMLYVLLITTVLIIVQVDIRRKRYAKAAGEVRRIRPLRGFPCLAWLKEKRYLISPFSLRLNCTFFLAKRLPAPAKHNVSFHKAILSSLLLLIFSAKLFFTTSTIKKTDLLIFKWTVQAYCTESGHSKSVRQRCIAYISRLYASISWPTHDKPVIALIHYSCSQL